MSRPAVKEIQFTMGGITYRKFTSPFTKKRWFREFAVDQRVIINAKVISASKFYRKLKLARKISVPINIYY